MSQITEATGLATMIAHLIGLEAKASKMLPKKVSEIAKMIKENQGFVVYHQDEFASFAGFKAWPHCLEVNGLITVPRFRHQGFGIAALEKAILGAQHYIRTNYWNREINTIVALANPDSAKLLHKLGFRHTIKTPVHAELWDDCPDCCEWHRWPNCHCQFMVLDGKLITCKNGRNFATINLASGDQTDLEKTAEFYCQVWREPPWSEDFWQPEKVAAEFVETMKVPGSGFRIAVQDESVIGLSIAYPISLSEIESRADGLEELIPSDYLPIYIAELAVSG
ncbi:MAG: GNAT family N-acetyltransferase, partial [Candidatus Berkelbacteria bacterium]|nr:GNAT family N-acetyltransferase [Candidatus Berkelbacteria bacterium]